jgi:mannose-6-phosphate isomerase-like protein (cupin superfamily)
MKNGYIDNIEDVTKNNEDFRRVLYTSNYTQLVVMSLKPGEEIGEEVHGLDQFIRIEDGEGKVVLNQTQEHYVEDDYAVVIPAGVPHNVINTGDEPLKLYSLYSPPEHKYDTVHPTKADEEEEHFDGVTSE